MCLKPPHVYAVLGAEFPEYYVPEASTPPAELRSPPSEAVEGIKFVT